MVDVQATKNEILVMYVRNILYQDIAPPFSIKKAVDLENLFFYLASNIASLYSFNKLAALVGLNDKTVKEYLGYFSAQHGAQSQSKNVSCQGLTSQLFPG
jgi:predicted AAA+ superfamily ATPase